MPEKLEIILPWPPKALNPNNKGHWAKIARAKAVYRYTCKMISKEAIQGKGFDLQPLHDLVASGQKLHVYLHYCPPNHRPRDDDNINTAFKSGRDGLADALNIDDRHFETHPRLKRDEIVKPGGEVRVVVTGKGPEA